MANLAKIEPHVTIFTKNVESTPDDPFSSEIHENPRSKAWIHQPMSSIMSTQPHYTFLGLLGIKIHLDCQLTPKITP